MGGRSSFGTYLGVELELHHVAWFGLDIVGVEGQRTVGSSDLNNVHHDHSRHSACRRGWRHALSA